VGRALAASPHPRSLPLSLHHLSPPPLLSMHPRYLTSRHPWAPPPQYRPPLSPPPLPTRPLPQSLRPTPPPPPGPKGTDLKALQSKESNRQSARRFRERNWKKKEVEALRWQAGGGSGVQGGEAGASPAAAVTASPAFPADPGESTGVDGCIGKAVGGVYTPPVSPAFAAAVASVKRGVVAQLAALLGAPGRVVRVDPINTTLKPLGT